MLFLSRQAAAQALFRVLQTFITAYLELIMLGQLKKGQSVLIHAGASGVGEALMMCGVPVVLLPMPST